MSVPLKAVLAIWLGLAIPQTLNSPPAKISDSAISDQAALNAATHDLCPRQIAMLGESATHGDGQTEAFKVALVKRLVNECGYDAVYFEANQPEFLHLNQRLRARQAIATDELSAAIGGLWRFDREFQPIVPFLLAKAQTGQISLGGIDDQLGQLGQDYANLALPVELSALLPQPQRDICSLALHRRVYSDYPAASPYAHPDLDKLTACLSAIERASAADKLTDAITREEHQQIIVSTQRWLSRDFDPAPQQIVARDRSMFQNFQWLRQHQPNRHKVILWAATVHIAKEASPVWGDRTGTNFGSLVYKEYGAKVFSLGISSLTGSYRAGRDIHDLPPAPPDSLEAQALHGTGVDIIYLGPQQLVALGTMPGAVFNHTYQTLPWANFLDGIVILREQHPPHSNRLP